MLSGAQSKASALRAASQTAFAHFVSEPPLLRQKWPKPLALGARAAVTSGHGACPRRDTAAPAPARTHTSVCSNMRALLAGASGPPRPCTTAPVAQCPAVHGLRHRKLAQAKARDGRVERAFKRRCRPPSLAAEWRSKRRMSDYRDVGVRRGRHSARSAGALPRHEVAATGLPGAMALPTFPVRKVGRSKSGSFAPGRAQRGSLSH